MADKILIGTNYSLPLLSFSKNLLGWKDKNENLR